MSGGEAEVPLLADNNLRGVADRGGDRGRRAVEQLEQGLTDPPKDFEGLLSENPQGIIGYLQDEGLHKLGELEVSVAAFNAAAYTDDFVVMGSEEHNINVHDAWHRYLDSKAHGKKARRKLPGHSTMMTAEAYVVAVRNAAATDNVGIVQSLLQRKAAGRSTMLVFALPAVQSVIHFKWQAFASKLVWIQLALYLLWLFSFTGLTWVFQDEDTDQSLAELVQNRRGILGIILACLSILAMLPFCYIELATFQDFGAAWFNFQNMLDMTTYILQAVIVVVYISRKGVATHWMVTLMAVQCILLWFRLQYYLRVFRATSRGAFIDSLKDVVADIRYYLLFLLFTLWGFATAFHILYKYQQHKFKEYSTMAMAMWTLYKGALGEFEDKTYLDPKAPPTAVYFFTLYSFIVIIILFNLTITLLTDAYSQQTGNGGLREVEFKAEICDELEQALPSWLKKRNEKKWFPAYIHVLKAKEDVSSEVKPSPLWGAGDLLDPSEQLSMRLEHVSEKLDQVLTELKALKQANRPSLS